MSFSMDGLAAAAQAVEGGHAAAAAGDDVFDDDPQRGQLPSDDEDGPVEHEDGTGVGDGKALSEAEMARRDTAYERVQAAVRKVKVQTAKAEAAEHRADCLHGSWPGGRSRPAHGLEVAGPGGSDQIQIRSARSSQLTS